MHTHTRMHTYTHACTHTRMHAHTHMHTYTHTHTHTHTVYPPQQVYSVEASDMADHSKELVKHNCLSAEIEVIKARAERVELPEKVDMIVSEWMGTLLIVRDGDPTHCKGWGPCLL